MRRPWCERPLRKIYPDLRTDDILAFRVARARQVYAVTTLNYSDRLPPMITSVPGLSIVNSAHIVNASLAVNETVALAEAALPRLLATTDVAATLAPAFGVPGIGAPA